MKTQADVSPRAWERSRLGHFASRTALAVAGVLIVAGAAIAFFGHELERHLGAIEAWVAGLGWVGMLAFAALVAVALCLFMPETLFSVAAGVLFGFWWGLALILTANVLAGALQYGLAYRLLREQIQRKLAGSKIARMVKRVVSGDTFKLQVLLRLLPIHQATVSYLLAASGVRFAQFMAALIAMFPVIAIEVYLGHTGKHLAMMSVGIKQASWQHNVLLLAGLLVMIGAVAWASRSAYSALQRAAKEGAEPSCADA